MPTFRFIVERTSTAREVCEVDASDLLVAAHRANEFATNRKHHRGVTIVRPFADDANATERCDVVQIVERA